MGERTNRTNNLVNISGTSDNKDIAINSHRPRFFAIMGKNRYTMHEKWTGHRQNLNGLKIF